MAALFIVSTPIGNLSDITLRALEILKSADFILAEDTRTTSVLLKHYGIEATPSRLISLHDHNEKDRLERVKTYLSQDKILALVSDAGTPLISDPGYYLVKNLRAEGFDIISIPGPSAVISALSISGLPTDRFLFWGFLPAKATEKRRLFESLKENISYRNLTHIFYESKHRLLDTLVLLENSLGDFPMVLGKELTKQFEQVRYDFPKNIIQWLKEDEGHLKGEFVILLHLDFDPNKLDPENTPMLCPEAERVLKILLDIEKLSLKEAVKLCVEITKAPKNKVYDLALKMHKIN